MNQETWTNVDGYLAGLLSPEDAALRDALRAADEAGLPPIQVSPAQGAMLGILARACGARRILEVGTLAGYSTIWLGRALPPGGRMVTLESEVRHFEVARANIAHAGLEGIVDIRLGRASELLPTIAAEGGPPFDLVFIDADKASTPEYFQWARRLTRPGSLIIVDNVVRDGEVVDPESEDPSVRGMRRLLEMAAADPKVIATAIQSVGVKGYDGFLLAIVAA